jgi:hypothetical protein
MDLGACPKSHTERLKTEFNAAKEAEPNNPIFNRFQMEYESNIFAFVDECDRRIRAAHRRLEKTPEENAKTTNLMREIAEIELAIQGGTEKIEAYGESCGHSFCPKTMLLTDVRQVNRGKSTSQ